MRRRGEEGGREGQLVADHHQHPVAGLDPEGAQPVGGHPGGPLQLGVGLGLLAAPVGDALALTLRHMAVDQPGGGVEGGSRRRTWHQIRTYSKSTGLAWIPLAGGATQLAMRPGSRTGRITDVTWSRSAAVGSQSARCASHSASVTSVAVGRDVAARRRPRPAG